MKTKFNELKIDNIIKIIEYDNNSYLKLRGLNNSFKKIIENGVQHVEILKSLITQKEDDITKLDELVTLLKKIFTVEKLCHYPEMGYLSLYYLV
jgi:predicted GNAT family N-acyltransferase